LLGINLSNVQLDTSQSTGPQSGTGPGFGNTGPGGFGGGGTGPIPLGDLGAEHGFAPPGAEAGVIVVNADGSTSIVPVGSPEANRTALDNLTAMGIWAPTSQDMTEWQTLHQEILQQLQANGLDTSDPRVAHLMEELMLQNWSGTQPWWAPAGGNFTGISNPGPSILPEVPPSLQGGPTFTPNSQQPPTFNESAGGLPFGTPAPYPADLRSQQQAQATSLFGGDPLQPFFEPVPPPNPPAPPGVSPFIPAVPPGSVPPTFLPSGGGLGPNLLPGSGPGGEARDANGNLIFWE